MNPTAVETGANVDTAREKVLSVLEQAKAELDKITDPQAKERRKAELAKEFWKTNGAILNLENDKTVVADEEDGLLEIIKRHFGQLPADNDREADRVANKMTQSVEAHVFFNDIPSDIGKVIFNEINKQNRKPKIMVLLYPIVTNIINKGNDYLTFNHPDGQEKSQFEKDLRNAFQYDKHSYNILSNALKAATTDPSRGRQNKAQLGIPENVDTEQFLMTIANEEQKNLEKSKNEYRETAEKSEAKRQRRGDQELNALLEYFNIMGQEEMMRLAKTLYSEEDFVAYVNELYEGGPNEAKRKSQETGRTDVQGGVFEKAEEEFLRLNPGVDSQNITEAQKMEIIELANKYFSDEFNERMRRMIGELHRSVDENNFKGTWQEAAQSGNPFYNINSLMRSLDNRLIRLKNINVEQFRNPHLNFYVKDQKDKRIVVENVSKFNVETDRTIEAVRNGKAVKLIERQLKVPVNEWRRINKAENAQGNWSEYITTVINSTKTEIGIRKFLHDARALPFLTVGHDESYLQMLQKFASAETDSTLFDSVHTLYDAQEIDATSNLSMKMRELAFARENWIFKPLLVEYDLNTGRNKIDDDTWAQLNILFRGKTEAEKARIFSAGVGANFGLDLSGLTGPSQADPAMKENGTPSFASFGERDAALYGGFNIMTMGHHRWGSEASTLWGLLYLPLEMEGDNLKEYFEHWDYRKLLQEQQKFVNSFVAGKDPKDIDQKTLRLVDLFNIGKGGSIYDRAGWRTFLSYEGWLVQEDPGKMDILKSWKALENIGIEPLKHFIGEIGSYNSSFYGLTKADGTPQTEQKRETERNKRRELFDYVYRKYFISPELEMTDDQIQQEMNKMFDELEIEKPDLSHHGSHDEAPLNGRDANYKKFFHQALVRAMVQRMPTKFIRTELERTRKVSGLRSRSWDAVFDLAKDGTTVTLDGVTYQHNLGNDESLNIKDKWESPDKANEAYFTALQDIVAAEVLLRKKTSEHMREEVDRRQGFMHEVDLGDSYNLTAERLAELWKTNNIRFDENEERDRARKLNALAVLKSTRKYLFTEKITVNSETGKKEKFIDDFAGKYADGLPHGPGFAMATEELAREFIVHRAAGENMPRRAFGDNVRLEAGVVKEIDAFFGSLYEVGTSHNHSFDKLVKHIKTVRDTLDGVHGQELAHRVSLWMATTAISLYKLNSKDEWLLGGALTPYHSSLMSFIAGGHTEHIWEWDRVTIREFMEALILQRVLPREPYSAQNAPSYETLYKVKHDGTLETDSFGNPIVATDAKGDPKLKRKQDFHRYAEQLAENFLQNPLREVAIRFAVAVPVAFIAMVISMIIQAYKKVNNQK